MRSIYQANPKSDRLVRRMGAVCWLGLGGFLLWAGFAPLEEGIAARGRIVVEAERKVVQHLEGGIIRDLRVREGDTVAAGDILVALEDTSSLAGRDLVAKEFAGLTASAQRLAALQSGAASPDFSVIEKIDLESDERADIIAREMSLFEEQRELHYADINVFEARREAAEAIKVSRDREIAIAEKALEKARSELAWQRNMLREKLVRRDQVTNLEREVSRLEGDIARLVSEREAAKAEADDYTAQVRQSETRFRQTIADDLLKTRTSLLTAEERLRAAQDVFNRSVIRAPVSGKILNLRFATIGGVVRPGEAIMEIIPDDGGVSASVRIRPGDRASLVDGQTVLTQISAYRSWRAPRLSGEVVTVSADLKTDPNTADTYYDARIVIPGTEIARLDGRDILPGMPVDVFIASGNQRTLLDYVLEPLRQSAMRGLSGA